jgi:hypothetical protein
VTPPHGVRQCWSPTGRFGSGFFGAGFFGAGAGLRCFLTGTILWKLMIFYLSAVTSVVVLQQFLYCPAATTCELI